VDEGDGLQSADERDCSTHHFKTRKTTIGFCALSVASKVLGPLCEGGGLGVFDRLDAWDDGGLGINEELVHS
jgi:hypothetical protein